MEIILSTLALFALFVHTESQARSRDVQLDPRPFWLIDQMRPSTLKDQLAMCAEDTKHYAVSDFSIGHRGACLQFPEHTLESYAAALEMGAGIVECDVTFTKDRQLICRHSQCDLHTTTNVVTIPDLNAKCTTPWSAGVSPNCCASDFTLDEIKTLCAKMDSSGPSEAATAEEYAYGGTADWRTDLYQLESCPEVPTHKESIAFIKAGNGYFTPELKSPSVEMPYEGNYTQEMYAQQMIDEYVEAGVPPEQVWPQSFSPDDVFYWIDNTEFGAQAVALDDQYDLNTTDVEAFLDLLVSRNVKIVAPPMQRLVDPAPDSEYLMTASHYANAAKNRSLGVIAWTLERSGPGLTGFYWETLEGQVELNEGDRYNLLHVLLNEVEVLGVFSDWPATTTFFANCMGASLRTAEEIDVAVEGSNTSASAQVGSIVATITISALVHLLIFT
jgi:glycerophosphoryl diester phosphodiesterase